MSSAQPALWWGMVRKDQESFDLIVEFWFEQVIIKYLLLERRHAVRSDFVAQGASFDTVGTSTASSSLMARLRRRLSSPSLVDLSSLLSTWEESSKTLNSLSFSLAMEAEPSEILSQEASSTSEEPHGEKNCESDGNSGNEKSSEKRDREPGVYSWL
eukprot:gnl/MRDRNA2_/MRDRNA2_72603_c0_seq1.p1 gnl/MRDRNA2_/MRDRNA2_72603_c0~~gnl/MRDRNA2_/MRDRNA2_72603_c0_seq1.p1  ORF type:complete len:157 (-),score=24.59 gnl/MRDRNA2_/MRDRNA2_72603_c0_seq1:96-566(-)